MKTAVRVLFIANIFVYGLVIGSQLQMRAAQTSQVHEGVDVSDYGRTLQLVQERHVGSDAGFPELFYGSVKGMVQALNDPYSEFVTPTETEDLLADLRGDFIGIGVAFDNVGEPNVVKEIIHGSPAEKTDLRPGDVVTAVDGQSVESMETDGLMQKLRGPMDAGVSLTVKRPGAASPIDIRLVRRTIVKQTVTWRKEPRDGHVFAIVTIREFTPNTPKQFAQAVAEARHASADRLIVDLRDNLGGDLNASVEVACHWAKKGDVIIWLVSRTGQDESETCPNDGDLTDMPTAVLVNGYTASASEIMTGALQDLGQARIIGEKTYGKGCAQEFHVYPDGAMLKLTAFLWKTPKRHDIHRTGITPDEIVTPAATPTPLLAADHDAQLKRAVRYLTGLP